MTDKPIATYVESTPEQVWRALTDADVSAQYWGHSNVSTGRWGPGNTSARTALVLPMSSAGSWKARRRRGWSRPGPSR